MPRHSDKPTDAERAARDEAARARTAEQSARAWARILATRCPTHDVPAGMECWPSGGHTAMCGDRMAAAGYPKPEPGAPPPKFHTPALRAPTPDGTRPVTDAPGARPRQDTNAPRRHSNRHRNRGQA